MENSKHHKFNWLALIFGPIYYGGYNKPGKAALLAIVGFIPLTLIFVNIYAGVMANRELDKTQAFSWAKACGIFLFQCLIMFMVMMLIGTGDDQKPVASEHHLESDTVEFARVSLTELRIDSDTLHGEYVYVEGVGSLVLQQLTLSTSQADMNPISVNTDNLSRDEKIALDQRCSSMLDVCPIGIFGLVAEDVFGDVMLVAVEVRL